MDKKLLCLLLLSAAFIGQAQTAQAATVSKMPGTKNMGIYAKVTKKGASKKVTTTRPLSTLSTARSSQRPARRPRRGLMPISMATAAL